MKPADFLSHPPGRLQSFGYYRPYAEVNNVGLIVKMPVQEVQEAMKRTHLPEARSKPTFLAQPAPRRSTSSMGITSTSSREGTEESARSKRASLLCQGTMME